MLDLEKIKQEVDKADTFIEDVGRDYIRQLIEEVERLRKNRDLVDKTVNDMGVWIKKLQAENESLKKVVEAGHKHCHHDNSETFEKLKEAIHNYEGRK